MFTELFGQSAPKSNLFHSKPHADMPRDMMFYVLFDLFSYLAKF
jgi:hypothetical protein